MRNSIDIETGGGSHNSAATPLVKKVAGVRSSLKHATKTIMNRYHHKTNSKSKRLCSIPLRTLLTLAVSSLVMVTAAGIFITLLVACVVVETDLVTQIKDAIQMEISNSVLSMVTQVREAALTLQSNFNTGLTTAAPLTAAQKSQVLTATLGIYKGNTDVGIGNIATLWNETNAIFGIDVSNPSRLAYMVCDGAPVLYQYALTNNVTGASSPTPFATLSPMYPMKRPYILETFARLAKGDSEVKYESIYIGGTDGHTLMIPVVAPVMSQSIATKVLGFVAINMSFARIRDFLSLIAVGKTGQSFVVDYRTGTLIGGSKKDEVLWTRDTNGKYQMVPAVASNNTLISTSAKTVLPSVPTAAAGSMQITIDSVLYYIGYSRIQYFGADWVVIVCVNSNDYSMGIVTGVIIALVVSLLLLSLASLGAILMSSLISNRISKITSAMIYAADMQLDAVDEILGQTHAAKSSISELRLISMCFVMLVDAMKQYRMFLPANILKKLDELHENSGAIGDISSPTVGDDNGDDHSQSSSSNSLSDRSSSKKSKHYAHNKVVPSDLVSLSSHLVPGAFDLGLVQKDATIMYVHLANFSSEIDKLPPADIVECLKHFVSALEMTKDGSVDVLSPGIATISFNCSSRVQNHQFAAAMFALQLVDHVQSKVNEQLKDSSLPKLRLSIGIATGIVLAGNVGSQSSRKFSLIGDTSKRAMYLEHLVGKYETRKGILVDETLAKKLNSKGKTVSFMVQPVDHVEIVHSSQQSGAKPEFDVYQLIERVNASADDEWMYKLEAENLAKAYADLLDGYEACKKGQWEQGLGKIEHGYMDMFPKDISARELLQRLKRPTHVAPVESMQDLQSIGDDQSEDMVKIATQKAPESVRSGARTSLSAFVSRFDFSPLKL